MGGRVEGREAKWGEGRQRRKGGRHHPYPTGPYGSVLSLEFCNHDR